ncbi:MAG: hypothetical protein IJ671_00770 [Succinivibrio sp.]|nr:hypothetical protein [Succinivibrio sp.]
MIFKTHTTIWHLKEGVKPLIAPDCEKAQIKQIDASLNEGRIIETDLGSGDGRLKSESVSVENVHEAFSEDLSVNAQISEDKKAEFPLKENDLSCQISDGGSVREPSLPSAADERDDTLFKSELFIAESNDAALPENDSEEANAPRFMVDGTNVEAIAPVDASQVAVAGRNTWMKLPYRLREKSADVFIDRASDVDFVPSLAAFLEQKGLKLRDYDDSVNYLPSDILIVDSKCLVRQGNVIYLQDGKRSIYNRLLELFPEKLG